MAAKRNMSVAMDGELQDKLKLLAEKKNVSVSMLIKEVCEKYLFAEDGSVKLILTIPADVMSNPARVEQWLQQKFQGLINHFKS
jgi:hypothetical protein